MSNTNPPNMDGGQYLHVHEIFREVMAQSDADRLAFLDVNRWVGYGKAQFILDTLVGLMNKPKRPRMPNLLIVGDSNMGKTTIIRRFESLCGQGYIDAESVSVRPIIIAESPPSADEKGLYISILRRFWAPFRVNDTAPALRCEVINRLLSSKVKVLVLDELHSILQGPPAKQRLVMNCIKTLCNELCIPVVGVGTRDAVKVLHTDPQHASRFDVISLPKWELDETFQKMLAGLEKILPLKKPSNLSAPEMATALHSISDGNLGDLQALLVVCAKEAIESGTECISMDIVKGKAWFRPTRGIRELEHGMQATLG